MGDYRKAAIGVAAVAVCVLAGCGTDSGGTDSPSAPGSSSAAAAPAPIPPSPVKADDKASEDAFAAKLEQDPCPKELSDAVLGILQNYQQKYRPFPGIDGSVISVDAAKSSSLTGIPQCTFTVTGAKPLSTITFSAVTAEDNKNPTGRLNIFEVIKPADPSIPSTPGNELACQITQEFLGQLTATGNLAQRRTEPKPVDNNIQVWNGELTGVIGAEWTNHLVLAQRRCADTRSTKARNGDSPDWIIEVAADNVQDPVASRKILDTTAAYLSKWVTGNPVGL